MNNKRKLLKLSLGIAVAANTLPSSWVKPFINSVVLPTHAQTSSATSSGTPTLFISGIVSNPVGGECGISSGRELVIIGNAGTGPADLTGFSLERFSFLTFENIANLSGTLAAGGSLSIEVCEGTGGGGDAVLNNTNGGVVQLLDASNTPIDRVSFSPVLNADETDTPQTYSANPSVQTPPRSS